MEKRSSNSNNQKDSSRKFRTTRDALTLISGSAISQAIIIGASPILTRLYSPEDFGSFSLFIAFIAFFSVSVFLRYELSISLINSQRGSIALAKLCLFIGLLTSFVLLIALNLSEEMIINYLGWTDFNLYLLIIPLTAFSMGLINLFHFWLVKKSDFRIMGASKVFQSSVLTATQLILGFTKNTGIGLIFGHFIGIIMTAIMLALSVFRSQIRAIRNVKFNNITKIARRYSNFPKYTILSDSFLIFGNQSPPIIIATYFSLGSAGYFLLAFRCSIAPVALVAQSIGRVFMSRALKLRHDLLIKDFVYQVYLILLKLSIVPFLLVAIISSDLVPFIFGETWRESGIYLGLLIPCVIGMFIFVPLMTLFIVLEQQKNEMNFQILILILRLSGMLIGVYFGDIFISILLYSLFAFCGYLMTGIWLMGKVGIKLMNIITSTLREIFVSILLISPFYYFDKISIESSNSHNMISIILLMITLIYTGFRAKKSIEALDESEYGV